MAQVKDIMTSDPAVCEPGDTLRDAAVLMKECDCGAVPVVESRSSRRLIGMITDRDIAVRAVAAGRGPDTLVRDAMTDGPDAVRANDDLKRVEEVMMRRQVRRVPVVDDSQAVVGIVAQADLARHHDHEVSDRELGEVVEKISEPSR